jgi:hypothetical protein
MIANHEMALLIDKKGKKADDIYVIPAFENLPLDHDVYHADYVLLEGEIISIETIERLKVLVNINAPKTIKPPFTEHKIKIPCPYDQSREMFIYGLSGKRK